MSKGLVFYNLLNMHKKQMVRLEQKDPIEFSKIRITRL